MCVCVREDGLSWQCALLYTRLWLTQLLLKTLYICGKEVETVAKLKGGAHSANRQIFTLFLSLSHFLPLFVSSSVCPCMLDLGHSIMSSCFAPENAFCEEYGNSGFMDHCTSPLRQKTIFHNLLICLTSSLNCILSDRCPPTWLMQRFVVNIAACYHIKPTDKLSAEPQTPSKPRYPSI